MDRFEHRPESQEDLDARQKLERLMTGTMHHLRTTPQVKCIGPRMPSWWVDDEDASDSSQLAMAQLERP